VQSSVWIRLCRCYSRGPFGALALGLAGVAGCSSEATSEAPPAVTASASAPLALTSASAPAPAPAPTVTARALRPGETGFDLLSQVYTVDKVYKSMQGPMSMRDFTLLAPGAPRELVWITGFQATMVAEDGKTPMPQEYMCHSNLDIEPARHLEAYGHPLSISGRLFTLSQGQFDIALPEGFGIPMWSDDKMSLTTQVLNLNNRGESVKVRHDVEVGFMRDPAPGLHDPGRAAVKPLFMAGVYGLKLLEGAHGNFDSEQPAAEHGTSCMMGEAASDGNYTDKQGKKFTGHWVVKPGREVNKTPVTTMLSLPFDTTIHYIAVHLHPFAESLTLNDLTSGKTVYSSRARQLDGKIGLAHVDALSSAEGIPVFKNHEYELVSVYNNTTAENQDSMAVMLIYLHDKEFVRRAPGDVKRASLPSAPKGPAPKKSGGM